MMHSAQHHRERAVYVWRLAGWVSGPALREQIETVAGGYDQITDNLDKPLATLPSFRAGSYRRAQ
jgi:uncharacterized protein with LGFP repeats